MFVIMGSDAYPDEILQAEIRVSDAEANRFQRLLAQVEDDLE